jgi:hypothetical protein
VREAIDAGLGRGKELRRAAMAWAENNREEIRRGKREEGRKREE